MTLISIYFPLTNRQLHRSPSQPLQLCNCKNTAIKLNERKCVFQTWQSICFVCHLLIFYILSPKPIWLCLFSAARAGCQCFLKFILSTICKTSAQMFWVCPLILSGFLWIFVHEVCLVALSSVLLACVLLSSNFFFSNPSWVFLVSDAKRESRSQLLIQSFILMFMWSVSSGRDLHAVFLKGTILFTGLMVGLYSFLLFFFFYINNAKSVISVAISGTCFIVLHLKIKWCFGFLCCWFAT